MARRREILKDIFLLTAFYFFARFIGRDETSKLGSYIPYFSGSKPIKLIRRSYLPYAMSTEDFLKQAQRWEKTDSLKILMEKYISDGKILHSSLYVHKKVADWSVVFSDWQAFLSFESDREKANIHDLKKYSQMGFRYKDRFVPV